MMKKIAFLAVFLLVVFSFSVEARRIENFSADDGYNWLLQQSKSGSYNDNIVDTAMAFLAIDAAAGLTSLEKNYLIDQQNENYCWPKTSCKSKETVFAVMALQKAGESSHVNNAAAWLKKAQTPTLTSGNWWLEIDTPNSGTCTIKYTKGTTEVSRTIRVEAGTFPDCGKTTFFDLKNCLEPGLLNSFASLELDIDCTSLSSAKISIAYNSGSSYYLYEEVSETTAKLTVKNGCFGLVYKDPTCNYESSLYAEWVLSNIGSSLSSELYLRENYDRNNALHNALLYIVTKDNVYSEQLKKLQKSDGSWDSSVVSTAFAIIALTADGDYPIGVENAQEWLKTKQNDDGSWNDKVFDTAVVLYSSFSQGVSLPGCTDNIKNQGEKGVDCGGPCEAEPYNDNCCSNAEKDEGEEGIDCGGVCEDCQEKVCDNNENCDDLRGEDCNNCPEDCQTCETLCSDGQKSAASAEDGVDCGGLCKSLFDKECLDICNNDGVCELNLIEKGYKYNEDSQRCPEDCNCGDEICDDYEKESGECSQDCPTEVEVKCGDGICSEGEDTSCAEDCTEIVCNNDGTCDEGEDCACSDCAATDKCATAKSSKLKWIILLLILIAVGGGIYFFLTSKKGKSEKSSFDLYGGSFGAPSSRRPPEKPKAKGSFFAETSKPKETSAPVRSFGSSSGGESRSKLDEDIDKSIKEAKKLIKE